MGVIDGTGLYHDAVKRIQQLEKLNATLAAEVDRQRAENERLRLVVDAAIEWKKYSLAESDNDELLEAISDYEASREGADGRATS